MLKNNLQFTVQSVKKLPARQETWVWFPSWEDTLEKGMATHSGILAWRIPWTEETGGYSPWGRKSQTRLSDSIITIHSFTKNALSIYLVPDPALGTGNEW